MTRKEEAQAANHMSPRARHFLNAATHLFDALVAARAAVFGIPGIVGALLCIVSLMNAGHPEATELRMIGQFLMLLALLGMFATRGLARNASIRNEADRLGISHPALDHFERAGESFRDVAATATDVLFGTLGIVGGLIVLANVFAALLGAAEARQAVALGGVMILAALVQRAARPADPKLRKQIDDFVTRNGSARGPGEDQQ